MVNFIYMHFSPCDFGVSQNIFAVNEVPRHQLLSMTQTRKLHPTEKIIFVCNPEHVNEQQSVQLKDINVEVFDYRIDYPILLKYMSAVGENRGKIKNDPFYKVTFFRYIFSEIVMRTLNLDNIMFIEGDNLLYLNTFQLKTILDNYQNTIVTCGRSGPGYYSSGIMYCDSIKELHNLNERTIELLPNRVDLDDMSLIDALKKEGQIRLEEFPCLPEQNSDVLFDPSSYGQYLGGDNHEKKPGYLHPNHLVGQFIIRNKDSLKFFKFKNMYGLQFNGKNYGLASLHIHNKDAVERFLI